MLYGISGICVVVTSDIRQLEHIIHASTRLFTKARVMLLLPIRICWIFTSFWEIGCKAISSDKDYQMYEAIRLLSIVKKQKTRHKLPLTQPKSSWRFTKQYGRTIWDGSNKKSTLVDCGIRIGTVENPKIYGAGLLSSIGESAHCMTDQVENSRMYCRP
jgi:phenylalanine-4-hydroxylase